MNGDNSAVDSGSALRDVKVAAIDELQRVRADLHRKPLVADHIDRGPDGLGGAVTDNQESEQSGER